MIKPIYAHRPFLYGFMVLQCFLFEMSLGQTTNQDSLMLKIEHQEGLEKVRSLLLLAESGAANDTLKNNFIINEVKMLPESKPRGDSTLDVLHEIGMCFFHNNQFNYSLTVAHKGLNFAIHTKDINYQIINHLLLSQNYFQQHLPDKSNHHLELASRLAEQNNLSKYKASILNTKANNATQIGNNLEALELYHQTAEILKAENNLGDLGVVYDNIGILHMEMNQNERAISYLKEAIKIIEVHGSKERLNSAYINLGVCYKEENLFREAEECYRKSITLSKESGNEFQLARVFMNLANIETMQKKYSVAMAYHDSSLLLCRINGIEIGVIFNKINLGELYLKTGQNEEALTELQAAETLSNGLSMPEQTTELYQLLSVAYEKLNRKDDAFAYYKKHVALRDSISGAESTRRIVELENQYEIERSARELAQEKEDRLAEKAKFQIIVISVLILLLGALAVAAYFYNRRRTEIFKAKLVEEEREKLRLNVESKEKELTTKAIHISKMNELALELSEKMKSLLPGLNREKTAALQQIIHHLEKGSPQNIWKEFETRFEQVHVDFSKRINELCPSLTPTEIKICSFLRLNLSTKEISLLTNRSLGTIDNARSSIRKKLNLTTDENLISFLIRL